MQKTFFKLFSAGFSNSVDKSCPQVCTALYYFLFKLMCRLSIQSSAFSGKLVQAHVLYCIILPLPPPQLLVSNFTHVLAVEIAYTCTSLLYAVWEYFSLMYLCTSCSILPVHLIIYMPFYLPLVIHMLFNLRFFADMLFFLPGLQTSILFLRLFQVTHQFP